MFFGSTENLSLVRGLIFFPDACMSLFALPLLSLASISPLHLFICFQFLSTLPSPPVASPPPLPFWAWPTDGINCDLSIWQSLKENSKSTCCTLCTQTRLNLHLTLINHLARKYNFFFLSLKSIGSTFSLIYSLNSHSLCLTYRDVNLQLSVFSFCFQQRQHCISCN